MDGTPDKKEPIEHVDDDQDDVDPLETLAFINGTYFGKQGIRDVLNHCILPLLKWHSRGVYVHRINYYCTGPNTVIVGINSSGQFVRASTITSTNGGINLWTFDAGNGVEFDTVEILHSERGTPGRAIDMYESPSFIAWSPVSGVICAISDPYTHTVELHTPALFVGEDELIVTRRGANIDECSCTIPGRLVMSGWAKISCTYYCVQRGDDIYVHLVDTENITQILEFAVEVYDTQNVVRVALCISYIVTVEIDKEFCVIRIHDMRGEILFTGKYMQKIMSAYVLVYPNSDKFAIVHKFVDGHGQRASINVFQIGHTPSGVWLYSNITN